ncbi:MAG: hypothetical protein JO363_02860 [Solirubrobacterales bacterium]|nr:hypothetical protein [Solirubrobacterales bacterium]
MYVVGPLLGALIAVGCAIILRGRGGDPIAHAAGSGVLTSGPREASARHAGEIEAGIAVAPRPAPTDSRTAPAGGSGF